MGEKALLFAVIVRIPPSGVGAFQEYETCVLSLLAEHGGVLQRRVRTEDGTMEIHLVAFPSQAVFEAYRSDPRRAAYAPLLAASGAISELSKVDDVDLPALDERT